MIKSKKIIKNITKANNDFFRTAELFLGPILLLAIRIWIGLVFFKSGLSKFESIDNAIYLFEYEYALPFLSPVFAAYSATFFELACPILLFIGLLTRFAAIPLIVISLVIQMLVFKNMEHYYWLFLLFTLFIFGAGKLSADKFLKIK